MDSIKIITGETLISDEGVNPKEYYKTASEGLEAYFSYQEEPKNRLEAIDTAMRVVLIPHHREIDRLNKKVESALEILSGPNGWTDSKIMDAMAALKSPRETNPTN